MNHALNAAATEVAVLNSETLVAELRALHRGPHRSRDTVLYARLGAELSHVDVELSGASVRFTVLTARSELELRAALADVERDSREHPVVVLVDFEPVRLPADLFGRVATGTIRRVTGDRLLRAIFSNANVSRDVLRARALCEALRSERDWTVAAPAGATVTLDAAWRAWLVRRGVFESEHDSELALLARVSTAKAPESLARLLLDRPALAKELDAWIDRAISPLASLWLALWLRGTGSLAAAVCFALDAVAPSLGREDYVDGAVRSQWEELFASVGRPVVQPTAAVALAERLATHMHGRDAELRVLLDEAQRWLPSHARVLDVAASSRFLRASYERRCRDLAACVERAVDESTASHVRDAVAALSRLTEHRLRELDSSTREGFERARMAVRLLGWLEARSRRAADDGSQDVVLQERSEDYVRSGAWVDYARAVARGGDEDALASAVSRVVRAVDRERDEDDQRFARALREWVELGRAPRSRALPIECALDRFAGDFLSGAPSSAAAKTSARDAQEVRAPQRRLLVVVLDGMSWANCVELLDSLGTAGYFKLRARAQHTDSGAVVPVLAALPTITEVSRSALLSGRLLTQDEERDTAKDVARFANHRRLRALGAEHTPKLLLKASLATVSGDASTEALALVESSNPIVGVVINAIDDQLKAGRQLRVKYELSDIRPLRALLDRATLAQRAVLLVADHGHVSGARMTRTQLARSEDGGSRWRAIRAREHGTQSEVTLGGPYVWKPKGFTHVAMLVGETDSNGIVPGAGEHGGASMAEVIAPAVLIGSETLAERVRLALGDDAVDPELEVSGLDAPPWWQVDRAQSASTSATVARAASKPRAAEPARPPQLALPTLALQVAAPVSAAVEPAQSKASKWGTMLTRSKAIAAMGTKVDPRWVAMVDALGAEGGRGSVELVATAAGVPPSRLEGLVARLSEVLNADGTPVLRFDAAARQVVLDLNHFTEIFGS
jgi:hypothetical protein